MPFRSLRLPLTLAALAVAAACRSPHVRPPRPSSESAPAAAKPAPRAVLQPLHAHHPSRIITPTRLWEIRPDNGVTISDGARNVGVAAFFTAHHPSDIALTADGEDAIVLLYDRRSTQGGQLLRYTGGSGRILERWNLATRTRRWSSIMPVLSMLGSGYNETLDHVTVSARGVFVTRCLVSAKPQNPCTVYQVDAQNGAVGAAETFSTAPLQPSWHADRIDAEGNRLSLRQRTPSKNEPSWFDLFDEVGRPHGAIRAHCARFEEGNNLWLDRPDPATLGPLGHLGVKTLLGPRACAPEANPWKALPIPSQKTGAADQSYPVIAGNRVVWQLYYDKQETFSLDITAPALPVLFELPPGDPAHPENRWELQKSTPELYAHLGKRYAYWPQGAAAPELGTIPHGGFLWVRGDALLLGYWPPHSDARFLLSLGTRASPGAPIQWRDVPATSLYTPGFTVTGSGGKATLVVAGGYSGLQRVDVASGQLLSRTCSTPKDPKTGLCSASTYAGLAASRDGATAWTYHTGRAVYSEGVEAEFHEIDLAKGTTARTLRAPRFDFHTSDDYKMGWMEPDKRFWFASAPPQSMFQACVILVTVPPAPRLDAAYEGLCLSGRPIAVEGDPGGRFFASFRILGTVDFFAPDGEQVLLVGVRSGGDTLAQTRDGRFACSGAACDEFRCIVGDEARPISDPACAHLRAPGFSLLEELARPRR